tara:strand:+ start:366 stop:842 length:477 start_codon:yes stop_codon:yes gene_type:complete
MAIPSGVFTKYAEVADTMLSLSGFGTACKLVYTEKIQTIVDVVPDIKQRKLMNLQKTSPDSGFKRGSTSFKTVETTEDITLRVYWDKKDFKKFGNIEVPDGGMMTIGAYSDLQKITRAKALLINTDKTGHIEWRFTKNSEPTIHGLDGNYFMCSWDRA